MLILHTTEKTAWESALDKPTYGESELETCPFLHCSTVGYYWRITYHFDDPGTDYVILCVDTDKLTSPVKWEDGLRNPGLYYPHIYGPIDKSAITAVLPYLRDAEGKHVKNPEFLSCPDE